MALNYKWVTVRRKFLSAGAVRSLLTVEVRSGKFVRKSVLRVVPYALWSPGSGAFWGLDGNDVDPLSQFLGTTNNAALQFKVNSAGALYIDSYDGSAEDSSPNLVAGFNAVGDGAGDTDDAAFATVAGVYQELDPDPGDTERVVDCSLLSDVLTGKYSTIGGGRYNVVEGMYAGILGGRENTASGGSAGDQPQAGPAIGFK